MSQKGPQVLVLDDDHSVLVSLERLLEANGYSVRKHLSPEDFFKVGKPAGPACLLLDQHLGAVKGTEVHAEMRQLGWNIPTIFLTADWDTHTVVHAMRNGADDFLTKPFDPDELLSAVARCLKRAMESRAANEAQLKIQAQMATLTRRELEIVTLVVAGMLNKQIAARLGVALVTVKVHRGRAMKKLGARNPAELARITAMASLPSR
jgi:FixJ family two-component response regulator